MGRKKIDDTKKNKPLTIQLPVDLYKQLEKLKLKNKSKLFQWILEKHFAEIEPNKR